MRDDPEIGRTPGKGQSAEEALRESEEQYRQLVENVNSVIIRMDRSGTILYFNEFARKFFGYSPDEVLGKNVKLLVPATESSGRDLHEMVDTILRDPDGMVENINENILKSGERVWVSWRNAAILDAEGNIVGNLAVGHDITARKRAEEALRESHERIQALAEATFEGIVLTEAGRILEVNDQLARMLGYGKDELIGAEVALMVFPEDRLRVLENIRKGWESTIEHRVVRKDGVVITVEAHGKPLTYEGRRIRVTALRDITERKAAEKQIARDKYLQQLLLDHFPGVVLLLRTTTREVVASNQAGIDVGAVPGSTCFDTWGQNPDPCPWCLAPDLWATGKEQHVVLDAGEKVMEAHWVPVTDDLYMHYAFDVTERKRAEEKLQEQERVIEQALSISRSFTFDWDTITDQVRRSASCKEIFGIDHEDLTSATSERFCQSVHPDDLPRFEKLLRNLTPAADTYTMDYRLSLSDGSVVTLEETAQCFFDAAGKMQRVIGVATDVTARRQAEIALRESEQRFATTLSSIGDAVIATDVAGKVTFINDVAEALTGWVRKEALGQPLSAVFKIINEQTRQPVENPVDKVLRSGKVVGLANHTLLIAKDGREIPIDDSGAPVVHDERTLGVVLVFRDFTERRRAEERANHLASFPELNPSPVIEVSASGEITFCNPATPRILKDMGLGEDDCEGFLPGDLKTILQAWNKKDESSLYREVAFQSRVFGVTIHLVPRFSVARIYAYDITERKNAEEALRQGEERFRTMANAIPQLAWIAKSDGYIFWYNQRWYDYTGTTPEEMEGWGWQRVHDPEVLLQVLEQWKTSIATGNPFDMIFPLRGADGEFRPFLTRIMPLKDASGKVIQWFGTNTDVTERKQMEEELRKSRDQLELRVQERTEQLQCEMNERSKTEEQLRQAQKMEALGTMSGGIAHDFNNILAAIIGFSELLEGHIAKGSRDARHLGRIMEAAVRGRELVRQMLTFSRKAEQEKKPLPVKSIVKETVKLIRAATPATISIGVNALSESLILGDPTQIQQVLMNLCTNATYAMREKGGKLDIELSDHCVSPSNGDPHEIKPGQYVRLTVRDTGTGISPDVVDRIFDPFFTTKKLGEGTGLGLSVVHGIVKQHDGYITVISAPGRGSTFTVYFPQITGGLEDDAAHDDEIPTGSERVLFVDDEEALVEMGEDILAELGYDVTSRMNGREALTLLKEDPSRFDLVITDQTMPEMTGIELAREAFAIRPGMPIIMCTGFSYVVDADKAKAAGIKAFAMKPLTKREIARTVRKVLDE